MVSKLRTFPWAGHSVADSSRLIAAADGPCTDTILVMCASAPTCASVGEYLSSTSNSGSSPGQSMLLRKLEHYFYWKANLGKIQRSVKNQSGGTSAGSSTSSFRSAARGGMASSASASSPSKGGASESAAVKRKAEWQKGGRGQPNGKRRRVRGGGNLQVSEEKTFKGPPGADPAKLEDEATKLADE